MTWISNLSITLSTIVIFFYLTMTATHFIIDGSPGREWYKEKYCYWFGFAYWLIINILQWKFV